MQPLQEHKTKRVTITDENGTFEAVQHNDGEREYLTDLCGNEIKEGVEE